jgi:two-component system cell cycle sensor histidine kinase/response regulator CckA
MSDIADHVIIDRSDRTGSAGLVIALAALLVGALAVAYFVGEDGRARFVLWFLAGLATIGVLGLFLLAVGGLQIAGRSTRNDLTRMIADEATDALLVTDSEGRIVYANRAYVALAGTTEGALVRPVERLFTGTSDVSEAVYRLARAARERRIAAEDMRLAPGLAGETVAWYRIKVRPIERRGRFEALWTVSDVTRDRERQENVFQELQSAVNYLDHAPVGFFSARPDGTIAYMNATLAGWLDIDIAELLPSGKRGGLTLAALAASNGAALLDTVMGVSGRVTTQTVDLDLRRKGGQPLPVRLIHRVAYGHDGAPGASRTIVINRSPGEDTAEGQRAAEVRLARFFQNAPMAIATVDADGRVTQTNATFARMLGDLLPSPEVRADTVQITAAVTEKDRAAVKVALAAAVAGRADIEPIDVALGATGQRSARVFVVPIDRPQSGAEAAILYMLETTDEKALQERLAQAQKMQAIGQLAGGVAHDFNNLLTAIIGFSDLLLTSHRPTDPSFQDIMQIKQNANRAAALVRQLLAFSRRQTLRPQVFQLNDAVTDVQMLLKRLVGDKVELGVQYGRDLWPVKADVNQFEQVVVNLAVNARDAMLPGGGKLTLRTANVLASQSAAYGYKGMPEADYVLLEVEDTGTGMTPEVMAKIFEPFFTTKEMGKGTGLGLAMVFGIIKQSGGFIFCESQVGVGTVFRVFLPRHIPDASEVQAKVEAEARPAAVADMTGRGTILLVEDEEAVRNFGARALRARGYTILEATNGAEALEIIEKDPDAIDVIVSDVVMPEMDGPSLLSALVKAGRSYPFIFASGYAEDAFRRNLPEGIDFGFLPKPYSLKQLIEAVKQMKA